ncbi:MAG: zinc-dependent peptidase, partial [Flavobacteriales bacterium]|nr:zinc-dependent peptidase [Flavobacteriales bacterium]
MAPIAVICFFAVVGTLVWVVGRELTGLVGLFGYFATPLAEKDRALIHQHSPYYRRLSPDQQREFTKRVKHVLFEKEWIGKGFEVTREMRVRIAATATELTMGFDRLLLLHFSRILVYPDAYVEESTGQRHLGG